MKDRAKLEALLAAVELYVIAIVREALNRPEEQLGSQAHNKATMASRKRLLTAIERMDP